MKLKQITNGQNTLLSCVLLVAFGLLQGCATTELPSTPPEIPTGAPKFPEIPTFDPKESIDKLTSKISRNPDDADLRLKLAQAEFEERNYPAAIDAANQAVKLRSPGTEAKSILFVSSMRLAMDTLAQLRSESQLNGNTRAEAERLVKSLRAALGENVLLPPVAGGPKPSSGSDPKAAEPGKPVEVSRPTKPRPTPGTRRVVTAAPTNKATAAPTQPTTTKPSRNPFGPLL